MNPKSAPDRLDRILAAEDELVPSSGFLACVMSRVREEAAAPPPIPFPWKRLLPGFILAAAVFVWAAISFVRPAVTALRALPLQTPALPVAVAASPLTHTALWLGFAAAISLAALLLSRCMARHGSLF